MLAVFSAVAVSGTLLVGFSQISPASAATVKQGCANPAKYRTINGRVVAHYNKVAGDGGFPCQLANMPPGSDLTKAENYSGGGGGGSGGGSPAVVPAAVSVPTGGGAAGSSPTNLKRDFASGSGGGCRTDRGANPRYWVIAGPPAVYYSCELHPQSTGGGGTGGGGTGGGAGDARYVPVADPGAEQRRLAALPLGPVFDSYSGCMSTNNNPRTVYRPRPCNEAEYRRVQQIVNGMTPGIMTMGSCPKYYGSYNGGCKLVPAQVFAEYRSTLESWPGRPTA